MWKELVPYFGAGTGTATGHVDSNGNSYSTELGLLMEGDCSLTAASVPLNLSQGMIDWAAANNLTDGVSAAAGGDAYQVGHEWAIVDVSTGNQAVYNSSVSHYYDGSDPTPPGANGQGGDLQYYPIFLNNTDKVRITKVYTANDMDLHSSSAAFYNNITINSPDDHNPGEFIVDHPDGLILAYNSSYATDDRLHLRFNTGLMNYNNGNIEPGTSWFGIYTHNHDLYDVKNGARTNGLAKYVPTGNSTSSTDLVIDNAQYQQTFTDSASDEWLIYNLNKEGTSYGNNKTPATNSPCAVVAGLGIGNTHQQASLVTAANATNFSHPHLDNDAKFTPVIYDDRLASLAPLEEMEMASGSTLPTYTIDDDGAGGGGDITIPATMLADSSDNTYAGSLFIWGNYLFANFTHLKAGVADINNTNVADAATNWTIKVKDYKVFIPQIILGDLTCNTLNYSLNMNFDLQNDITDAANITNMITIESGTVNESDLTSPFGINDPFIGLEGGSSSTYALTSLWMGTVDNDVNVDNVKDMFFAWTHGVGASGGSLSGSPAREYVALTSLKFGQFNPNSGSNSVLTDMNRIHDGDTLTNDDLKDLFHYNETSGLCDRSLFNAEDLDDFTDDFCNSGVLTFRGDMWNKPGTDIANKTPGDADDNARIFVRIPRYSDGYEAIMTSSGGNAG